MATEDTPPPAPAGAAADTLPGGWVQCDADCKPPARRGGQIWCLPTPGCTAPCQCRLFRLDPRDPDAEWEMVAGSGKKVTEDRAYIYRCWCVKPAPGARAELGADIPVKLRDIVDTDYADFAAPALAAAPVDALLGVSAADAAALEKAFGVTCIRDLAELKFVRWSQAIVALADGTATGGGTRACEDIPALGLDYERITLQKTRAGEKWLDTVARFVEGVGTRHCRSGTCASGTCVGAMRNGSVRLLDETDTTVTVAIKGSITCRCEAATA